MTSGSSSRVSRLLEELKCEICYAILLTLRLVYEDCRTCMWMFCIVWFAHSSCTTFMRF